MTIDELVKTLPELHKEHRLNEANRSPLTPALRAVCSHFGRTYHWNTGIDLLDEHYPGWRGYENPKVLGRVKR